MNLADDYTNNFFIRGDACLEAWKFFKDGLNKKDCCSCVPQILQTMPFRFTIQSLQLKQLVVNEIQFLHVDFERRHVYSKKKICAALTFIKLT